MVLNWKQQQHLQQLEQQRLQDAYSQDIPTQWQQASETATEPAPTPEPTPPNPPPTQGEDLTAIKSALEKEREMRRNFEKQVATFQKQMEAFKDIDPEKARQAEEILRRHEEFEAEQAKLRAEIEDRYKSEYQPQVENLTQEVARVRDDFIENQILAVLERAYNEAEGFPGEFPMVANELRARIKSEFTYDELRNLMRSNPAAIAKKIKALDAAGKPAFVADKGEARDMTLAELIGEMKKSNMGFARHFKANEKGGVGISGTNPYGVPGWENMNHWEKVRIMREKQHGGR